MNLRKLLIILLSISAIIYGAFSFAAKNGSSSFTASQRDEIEDIIHDYLVDNPDVMIEVAQKLQKQERAVIDKKAQKAIQENSDELFRNAADPVAGNPNGDVTIVEFFDYQCGYCKRMVPVITKLIKSDKNFRFTSFE